MSEPCRSPSARSPGDEKTKQSIGGIAFAVGVWGSFGRMAVGGTGLGGAGAPPVVYPQQTPDPFAALFIVLTAAFVWSFGLRGLKLGPRGVAMSILSLVLLPVYETTDALALLRPLVPQTYATLWYTSWLGPLTLSDVLRYESVEDVEVGALLIASCAVVAVATWRAGSPPLRAFGRGVSLAASVGVTLGLGVYLFLPAEFDVHVTMVQSLFGIAPFITNEVLLLVSLGLLASISSFEHLGARRSSALRARRHRG